MAAPVGFNCRRCIGALTVADVPASPIAQGSAVRLQARVGTVTYLAAGFADVAFAGGDWSVVPVSALEAV